MLSTDICQTMEVCQYMSMRFLSGVHESAEPINQLLLCKSVADVFPLYSFNADETKVCMIHSAMLEQWQKFSFSDIE